MLTSKARQLIDSLMHSFNENNRRFRERTCGKNEFSDFRLQEHIRTQQAILVIVKELMERYLLVEPRLAALWQQGLFELELENLLEGIDILVADRR